MVTVYMSDNTKKVISEIEPEGMEQQVADVLQRNRIKPLQEEWHTLRGTLLTASDMASVLGENPFSTPMDVLRKKRYTGDNPFRGNKYTRWGQKYEREAADVYEEATGLVLVEGDIGFLRHPIHERYGATPDFITKSGIMVEIKCPYKRKIGSYIPRHYIAQVQCQLEICGLETAHFVQYVPHITSNDGMIISTDGTVLSDTIVERQGRLEITVVKRDPSWWYNSLPIFDRFMDVMEGKRTSMKEDYAIVRC